MASPAPLGVCSALVPGRGHCMAQAPDWMAAEVGAEVGAAEVEEAVGAEEVAAEVEEVEEVEEVANSILYCWDWKCQSQVPD